MVVTIPRELSITLESLEITKTGHKMSSLTSPKPVVKPARATTISKTAHIPAHLAKRHDSATPFNTPADKVPVSAKLPISAVRDQVAGRPINAASAMRGRGIAPHPHAATPSNTPSSMERISRRIAQNLVVGATSSTPQGNKIVPSYESVVRMMPIRWC